MSCLLHGPEGFQLQIDPVQLDLAQENHPPSLPHPCHCRARILPPHGLISPKRKEEVLSAAGDDTNDKVRGLAAIRCRTAFVQHVQADPALGPREEVRGLGYHDESAVGPGKLPIR
jgi:hypothetical protein